MQVLTWRIGEVSWQKAIGEAIWSAIYSSRWRLPMQTAAKTQIMNQAVLSKAERRFRAWMLFSAWMYAIAGLGFLLGGGLLLEAINAISARVTPSLPPYPLPADMREGCFWLTLSFSMMMMLVYICYAVYREPCDHRKMVPILLLSKVLSSFLFISLFARFECLAYLVGFFSDTSLFLATLAFWLPIAASGQIIDSTEADILAAIGDAMFPKGGPFEWGYADFREQCLEDTRRMFAAYHPPVLIGVRCMLRAIDLSPVLLMLRPVQFRRLAMEERQQLLLKLEQHWFIGFRMISIALKMIVAVPFFNRKETMRAVGYLPKEEVA